MSYPVTHRRFTVDEYHRMAEMGILKEGDRVELINGEIIEMSPISSRHAAAVDRIMELFKDRIGKAAFVRVQNPIRLNDLSEPQPDLAIVKRRGDFYAQAHPTTEDVWLVIEVAESSAVRDRIVKMPAYANAQIAELWLVDLPGDVIEVYRDPVAGSYQSTQQARRGETLTPQSFPSINLKVDEMLG